MKQLYVRLGLMCDFEDVSQGHIAAFCILAIGTGVFLIGLGAGMSVHQ